MSYPGFSWHWDQYETVVWYIPKIANSALGYMRRKKGFCGKGIQSLIIALCADEAPAVILSATFKDSHALEHYQKTVNRFLEGLETVSWEELLKAMREWIPGTQKT